MMQETFLPTPTCYGLLWIYYGETGVMNLWKTCYREVANLLRPCCWETGLMDFGLYHVMSCERCS